MNKKEQEIYDKEMRLRHDDYISLLSYIKKLENIRSSEKLELCMDIKLFCWNNTRGK